MQNKRVIMEAIHWQPFTYRQYMWATQIAY